MASDYRATEIRSAQHELFWDDRRSEADRYKPVVMRIGQAAEKNPIHHAEHRCCGADAERQCSDGRDCEDRIAPKSAQGVAHIAQQILKPRQSAPLAMRLPRLLHAAKANQRLPPRFFRSQARANAFLGVHGHVAFEFGIKVGVVRRRK